jgi:hypothetical protein
MRCPQTHLADEISKLSGIGLDVIVENEMLLFVMENRLLKKYHNVRCR